MRCILVLLIAFAYSSACASPPPPGTPKGDPAWGEEDRLMQEGAERLDKENLAECLNRRGGDTTENRQKCKLERDSYSTFMQECFDRQRAQANAIDTRLCKEEAELKSQNLK